MSKNFLLFSKHGTRDGLKIFKKSFSLSSKIICTIQRLD